MAVTRVGTSVLVPEAPYLGDPGPLPLRPKTGVVTVRTQVGTDCGWGGSLPP